MTGKVAILILTRKWSFDMSLFNMAWICRLGRVIDSTSFWRERFHGMDLRTAVHKQMFSSHSTMLVNPGSGSGTGAGIQCLNRFKLPPVGVNLKATGNPGSHAPAWEPKVWTLLRPVLLLSNTGAIKKDAGTFREFVPTQEHGNEGKEPGFPPKARGNDARKFLPLLSTQ
jgi:hypothetical protein